ncbi:hypothetical protein TNCV_3229171 [Trichonephila clavipes]|nr:hypothetical protein TNCV_3229171 [Trichonephila clavipes]
MPAMIRYLDHWATAASSLIGDPQELNQDRFNVHQPLYRVVEELDGTVESTDTIAKLKTKIEKSSSFESDPDFVKTLIQNCIDERVSKRNRGNFKKQKIELAKLQLAQLEKEVELKNKALCLNPAAKVEEKQFETLNKETATHIGIREAEDWFIGLLI